MNRAGLGKALDGIRRTWKQEWAARQREREQRADLQEDSLTRT
jgi:hypothetical protein